MTSNDDNQSRDQKALVPFQPQPPVADRFASAHAERGDQAWQGEIITNPDIKIHSSVWSFPEAKPGARIAAFVLDVLILTAAFNLLGSLFVRVFDQEMPQYVSTLLTTVYFIVFHKRSGQTLGKKFVGIRVLPLEHSASGLPLASVIIRETVGRFLSVVLFGYGYIRIFFRDDRMGLHDSVARTRVASLGHEKGSAPIQFRYIAAGFVVLVAGGISVVYYMINYTAYPLRQYAKKLEAAGFQIEGIEGSPSRGFSIARIARETEAGSIELTGAKFRYTLGSGDDPELTLSDLSLRGAKILVRQVPQLGDEKPGTAPIKKKEEAESGPFGSSDSARSKSGKLPSLVNFSNVDINDVELQVPGRGPYHLKRLVLSDLKLKPALKFASFERLWLDSDSALIDLKDVIVQDKTIAVNKPAYIEVRPALYPEVLKMPVDVQFEGVFEDYKPTKLSLSAFAKKLNVKWQGESGELTIASFTPLHYFKTELPIWDVNFRLSGDFRKFSIAQMQGSLGVRNVRFTLEPEGLRHTRVARQFTLAPRLQADWKNMLAGRDPGLILGSSDKLFSREALSAAYFSKPVAQLSPQEREMVDTDARYFTDTIDAGVVPLPVIAKLPSPQRAPTSAGKRAGLAKGVPTKLPPFRAKQKRR